MKEKIVVQIGCGKEPDDDIKRYLSNPEYKIFFVEANIQSFNSMKSKIAAHTNADVSNFAINMKTEDITFYYSENFQQDYAQSSLSKHHIEEHVNGRCQILEAKIPGISFVDFCKLKNIKSVDYLILDTEGCDAEILKSIDFSQVDVKKIKFEIMHLIGGKVQFRELIPFLRKSGFNSFTFYFEGAGNMTAKK